MSGRLAWSEAGPEPYIDDLLADPIVHLVMRRDRLTAEDVWAAVRVARDRLRATGTGSGANRRTAA